MPITEVAPPPPPVTRSRTVKASPTAAIRAVEAQKDERLKRRIDGMNTIGTGIHLGLLVTGLRADAGAVNKHTPTITKSLAEYAEHDDKFGAQLDRLSDVTPTAAIVTAVLPLTLQVLVNHKLFGFRAEMFAKLGVVSPETLEAETNTFILEQQKKAIQAQIAAAEEVRIHAQILSEMEDEE